MPQRNGLEILRLLRRSRPNLLRRFLLMTGNLADAEESAAELNGIPILHKPFTLSQLSEAVRPFLPQDKESERR
jgi:CheY-like chemotaxis protein